MKHLPILFAVPLALALLAGCGAQPIPTTATEASAPEASAPEAPSVNGLMTEWHELAKAEYENMDFDRAAIIAAELALQGPNSLEPLFKVVEDPDATAIAKMLATASLAAHVTNDHVERLIALTDSTRDQSTRGCATHLLGNCLAPEAFFKVNDLTEDPDSHVSKIAAMVMLRKGNEAVLPKIIEIWDNPDTLDRDRAEIVRGIGPLAAIKHTRILTESICNAGMDTTARSRAIQLLGDMGSADVLPTMKSCLEKEEDTALHDLLDAAIALIEKRDEEGISAVPVQIPAGMDVVFKPKQEEAADNTATAVPDTEQE